MTDKQIILDGVDVSRCCRQGKDNTCTCPHYKKECGRNPNCHYKIMQRQTKKLDKFYKSELELKQKLFRKEQEHQETQKALAKCWIENGRLKKECEELKAKLELFKTSNQTTIDQLKAKNEELEEKYKWFDHYKEQALYNKNLCNEQFNELTRFKKENKKLKKENDTLFKAIEEVNKINKRLESENEILENDKASLAVIIETLKAQFKQLKQILVEIKEYCEEQNLKADWTACEILQKINKCEGGDEN